MFFWPARRPPKNIYIKNKNKIKKKHKKYYRVTIKKEYNSALKECGFFSGRAVSARLE
jgi:hypothetical protein